MLSRVANSVYWMSRYIERAENVARCLDVVQHLVLDLPGETGNQWSALIQASGDDADFSARYGKANEDSVERFLVFDHDNPNSIVSCLGNARENARRVREIISSEMWEQVNRSYHMIREAEKANRLASDPASFFAHFKKACHLFAGIADATMTHNDAWLFMQMGRLMERADKTSRILDAKYYMLLPRVSDVGSAYDDIQWAALLKSTSALEMYRKRHHRIDPKNVAEFLLLDREFPRSIRFSVTAVDSANQRLSGGTSATFANPAGQRLGRLRADLDYTSIEEVLTGGLHEYLDGLQMQLNDAGAAIHESYFGIRASA